MQLAKPPANVTFAWIAWPFSQLEAVFDLWQSWAPTTNSHITSELYMAYDGAPVHRCMLKLALTAALFDLPPASAAGATAYIESSAACSLQL